ncbi:transketolase-like TK C-terminal-containing protein [Acetobacter sp. DmW_043]|uniref:transketolase-like TK C-terminal-containing protein n=1 Tax=Acetobacter sp. DmW_043 TaxID=1670658 RepID=UPI000A3872FB|nr:transketolase C-terminal domain-containing protein [Acetobacter sp. DmW_043]
MATSDSTRQGHQKKNERRSAQATAVLRMAGTVRQLLSEAGHITPASRALVELMCLPVTALWCRVLRFDPQAPTWPDRDRFLVPSASMLPLLDIMLSLTGSSGPYKTPQNTHTEMAPGPASYGIAAAAGMALGEQTLASRFGRSLINHRTWAVVQDTDLASGAATEVAQLAGQSGLDRLTLLVASLSDSPSPELITSLALFQASGWNIRKITAGDLSSVTSALAAALRSRKPTLIVCSPSPARKSSDEQNSLPPAELTGPWSLTARRGASARRSWLRRLVRHRQRSTFQREQMEQLPPLLSEDWLRTWRWHMRRSHDRSTKNASLVAFHTLAGLLPEIMCLSSSALPLPSDILTDHTLSPPENSTVICGSKAEGMSGLMIGLALHGGLLACCQAPLIAADRMMTALRMVAFMRRKVLLLLTENKLNQDCLSGGLLSAEQLPALRAIPHLAVFRPANVHETFQCWEAALRWKDGPCVLSLTPDENPDTPFPKSCFGSPSRGGYLLQHQHAPQVTLIASGSEVAIALEASHHLTKQEIRTAVVSLPCWKLFADQPETYRQKVLGGSGIRVGIEAASGFGWEQWLSPGGVFVDMNALNISAQTGTSYDRSGSIAEAVCEVVKHHLFASGMMRDSLPQAGLPSVDKNAESHSGKVIKQEWKTQQWQSK